MGDMSSSVDPALVGTRIPPHSLSQVVLGKPRGMAPVESKRVAFKNVAIAPSLGRALYLVAALLVVTPLLDVLSNVWPLAIGDLRWRYGTVGLLSGFLLTSLLGMALAVLTAVVLRQRRVLSVLSVLNLVAAVTLLAAAGLFVLDVLQVRGTVPVESRSLFDVGAVKALFKHATLMVSFAALGIGARSSISQRPADRT